MESYDNRVLTFVHNTTQWPNSLPIYESMCEAGFYFTPTEKNSDCCTCYQCGIKMFNWLPGDSPRVEHKKFSSNCKLAKSVHLSPEDQEEILNSKTERAQQVESEGTRHKAKKFLGGLVHRKSVAPNTITQTQSNSSNGTSSSLSGKRTGENPVPQASASYISNPIPSITPSTSSTSISAPIIPERSSSSSSSSPSSSQLSEIERQKQVAIKALQGLNKLVNFYQYGSPEYTNIQKSIQKEKATIEQLQHQEMSLRSNDIPEPIIDTPSDTNQESYPLSTEIFQATLPSRLQFNDSEREYWIQYHTEQGTPYFYSTKTKETYWSLPEGQTAVSEYNLNLQIKPKKSPNTFIDNNFNNLSLSPRAISSN